MQTDLYNSDGAVLGKVDLPEAVFGRKWNPDLVHQALVTLEANSRRPLAHAKGRGEVSGGGKKPWRQKGTGRARHGSIRSPLWAGGGVTHGPTKERIFEKKLNKKMRRLALAVALSRKARDGEVRVVRSFGIAEAKTKNAAKLFAALFGKNTNASALLVSAKDGAPAVLRAARNLKNAKGAAAGSLNLREVLRHNYVVIEEPAVAALAEKTSK